MARTLEEINKELIQALTDGNETTAEELVKEKRGLKADIKTAETARLLKEEQEMAQGRLDLATALHKAVKGLSNISSGGLERVKAEGFTFKLDTEDTKYTSVSLTLPQAPKKRQRGETLYGESLAETMKNHVGKFTNEEKARLAKAKPNNVWNVQNNIRKRLIAEGVVKPLS